MQRSRADRLFELYRRTGDPRALGRVFDKTAPELVRVARYLSRDPHRVEDLVQSTFLTALERAATHEPGRPVLPWLLTILANRARAWRRADLREAQRGARVVATRGATALDAADEAAQRELAETCDATLETLPEPYRGVLILHLRHGLDAKEIATAFGCSGSTVRNRIARGLEKLRRALPAGVGAVVAIEGVAAAPLALGAMRASVLASASGPTAPTLHAPWLKLALGKALMTNKLVVIPLTLVLVALGSGWVASQRDAPLLPPGSAEAAAPDSASPARSDPSALEDTVPEPTRRTAVGGVAGAASAVAPQEKTGGFEATVLGGPRGKALAGVPWFLTDFPGRLHREGRSSEDGKIEAKRLTPGGYMLHFPYRVGPQPVFIRAGVCGELEVRVGGFDVSGLVVDAGGQPIAGATVHGMGREGRHVAFADTDAAGRFELQGITRNGSGLWASAPGHGPSPKQDVKGGPGLHPVVRLVLGATGHRLTGRVVDKLGKPVVSARIAIGYVRARADARAVDSSGPVPLWDMHFTRTDERGEFHLDWLPTGDVRLIADAPDDSRERRTGVRLRVDGSGPREVILTLGDNSTVVGRVTDAAGAPVADVSLAFRLQGEAFLIGPTFGNSFERTRDDGEFEVRGLLPGNYSLEAEVGGITVRAKAELAAGAEFRWEPRVVPSRTLEVRLVDEARQPLANWRIEAKVQDGPYWQMIAVAVTEAEGVCRLGGLASDVPVRVVCFAPTKPLGDARHDSFPAILRDGVDPGTGVLNLELAAKNRPSVWVRGRVVDSTGSPRPAVRIELHSEGWDWPNFTENLGEHGRFEWGPFPPGAFRIEVKDLANELPVVRKGPLRAAPGGEVNFGLLQFADAARLEVVLRVDDGGTVAGPVLVLDRVDGTAGRALRRDESSGSFRSRPLVPGRYTLSILAEDAHAKPRTVDLRPGQTERITLSVERGSRVPIELRYPRSSSRFINGELVVDTVAGDRVGRMPLSGHFDDTPKRMRRIILCLAEGAYHVTVRDGKHGLSGEAKLTLPPVPRQPVGVDVR